MISGPVRTRLIGLLVAILIAAAFLFSFSRTKTGRALFAWVTGQIEVEEVRGRIVDSTTGAGVSGATVIVSSFSGTWSPSIVGEISHGADTTDADGRFVVPYQRLGTTRISARAPGYATIFRVPLREQDTNLVLPTGPATPGEVEHRGEVGFDLPDTAVTIYFDLASHAVVPDEGAADLAFRINWEVPEHVLMWALGEGSLLPHESSTASHAVDSLAANCIPRQEPYMDRIALLGNTTDWPFFVRLHDGKRYCRANIRVYGRGPTPVEGYRVEIERWLNTAGGRNVCLVPVDGEQNEFAPAERAARVAR